MEVNMETRREKKRREKKKREIEEDENRRDFVSSSSYSHSGQVIRWA